MTVHVSTTVCYTTNNSKTICSIKFLQRNVNDPSVIINSPNNQIPITLYNFISGLTTMVILLEDVYNSSFSDYINSITLCMIKSGLKYDYLVSSSENSGKMVYCPSKNTVKYLYFESYSDFQKMKADCFNICSKLIPTD